MLPILFAGVVGLSVGSFANVFLYRYPLGLSLWRPGSRCPQCGHAVRWRHNVPVLGWLVLRGRCHDCGSRIPAQYPLVEAAFGALAAGMLWRFGPAPATWVYLGFFMALLLAALADWRTQYLYDVITLPMAVAGACVSLAFPDLLGGRWQSPLAMVVAYGAMLGLMHLARWLFGREEALGEGDVKLLAAAAGFLGLKGALAGLFLASMLGLPMMALYSRLHGTSLWKDPGPFGPALALGCAIAAWDVLGGSNGIIPWLGLGPA